MTVLQSNVQNKLLAYMSAADFAIIVDQLEWIDLPRLFTLSDYNEVASYCYFIETGLGSVVARSPEGQKAEVGIVGNEGLTSTAAVLEAGSSPHEIFMQIAGDGFRISTPNLLHVMGASASLRRLFNRYVQTAIVQSGYTAMSNAVHHVDERLARWLLMCHDRVVGNHIAITHDFLAVMLAVRRPSVTTSLHVLEGNHFIKSERGMVTVLDRKGLTDFAHDAYGAPEFEYERLIGPLKYSHR